MKIINVTLLYTLHDHGNRAKSISCNEAYLLWKKVAETTAVQSAHGPFLVQQSELFIKAGENAVSVWVCLDVNQGGTIVSAAHRDL